MSDSKWTPQQLEAITRKNCNLLVAAAAGAGKTAVLVERIIRKITNAENPVDIDRLLVVTFTNAAATEMKERIGEALAKLLESCTDAPKIHRQLMYLNKSSITTIHSFCLEVIKNNFHCIDLDPDFRVADETEATLLKLETLEELFEEKYETENSDSLFYKLLDCYGNRKDDRGLKNIVINLYDFIQSHPWPLIWLEKNTEAFNISNDMDFSNTIWGKAIINGIYIDIAGLAEMTNKALKILETAEGLEAYYSCFSEDADNLEKLKDMCLCSSWDKLYEEFRNFKFGKLSRCGKNADKSAQEEVKAIRDKIKKGVKKITEQYFSFTSSEIARDLQELYPLLKCLSNLVTEFMNKYNRKKRSRSLLDFNDLEHFCLEILVKLDGRGNIKPTDIALALREKYDEILIDEYQDSNLVQEVILKAISKEDEGNPNIFMVGDVKQSIYRFRQARPELFMEKYLSYSCEEEAQHSKNVRILLYKNFRSREAIVNGVNYIFRQIMSRHIGELDYTQEEALNYGALYPPAENEDCIDRKIELHIMDTEGTEFFNSHESDSDSHESDEQETINGYEQESFDDFSEGTMEDETYQQEERLDNIQLEARMVGKRIKDLVNGNLMVFDNSIKQYRKVQYRDIVILLRTTKNWSEVFVEELENMGIPVFADTGTGYFKTVEVQTVMSLLQIIDNPMQDIPFLTVLRSPIGMFSPEELAEIRMVDVKSTFYEVMKKYCGPEEISCVQDTGKPDERGQLADELLKEKVRNFLEKLNSWRDISLHLSTDELIWFLYTETGYYSFVGTLPGGEVRQANLRILFERARQFEETSYKGLFNFVNFIDRLKSRGGDFGSAMLLGENDNLVRIMSIHKSKGLEFPVVFVSGCGKKFNMQDMKDAILIHQDLGFGPDYIDAEKRIYYATVPKQAIKSKIKLETLSEEMRILYVALTRAKEKLIITGYVKNIEKTAAAWAWALESSHDKLPVYMISRANCFLDWIGPAVIRHPDSIALRQVAGCIGNMPESMTENMTKNLSSPITLNPEGDMACSKGERIMHDASGWEIRLWNRDSVLERAWDSETAESLADTNNANSEENINYEEIKKKLSWEYPYKILSGIPAKVSVTELKRMLNENKTETYEGIELIKPSIIRKPVFLQETRGLSAAEKGTILHFVMQHLDISKVDSKEDIKEQINNMVSKEFITQQQADTVDVDKILRFFKSPLGKRVRSAEVIKREVPFNIEISAASIVSALKDSYSLSEISDNERKILKSETILLQGIIDCFFEEEEEIVLLDYKTDYVDDGNMEEIKKKYKEQIQFYQEALERITGKKVKEKYLYIFSKNAAIEY
ncbi:MAG TPA: helicase-exonuclease AddAB subunit AddA [Clostridiaceae bacterium]|nr:helicase-exonuclease AddAB subunit AddA [Clostridiaceae bacterium]